MAEEKGTEDKDKQKQVSVEACRLTAARMTLTSVNSSASLEEIAKKSAVLDMASDWPHARDISAKLSSDFVWVEF